MCCWTVHRSAVSSTASSLLPEIQTSAEGCHKHCEQLAAQRLPSHSGSWLLKSRHPMTDPPNLPAGTRALRLTGPHAELLPGECWYRTYRHGETHEHSSCSTYLLMPVACLASVIITDTGSTASCSAMPALLHGHSSSSSMRNSSQARGHSHPAVVLLPMNCRHTVALASGAPHEVAQVLQGGALCLHGLLHWPLQQRAVRDLVRHSAQEHAV